MDYLIGGAFQFHSPRIDPISLTVTPIELISDGTSFAHGTGFLWKDKDRYFLITCWHNFSGQDPFTASHLNSGGRVPDRIRLYPAGVVEGIPGDGATRSSNMFRKKIELPLYTDFHSPFWKQHRRFADLRIDICALELPQSANNFVAINNLGELPNLFTHVGSDLFIVGYPFSDFDQMMLMSPIWKSGTLASETLLGWKGRPVFLIDSASRPGMSGSPVIRRIFGPAAIPKGDQFEIKVDNVMTQEFIGIYAGHFFAKSEEVTIGLAWYGNLIQELISDPCPGGRL